jgi:hypothetical protein
MRGFLLLVLGFLIVNSSVAQSEIQYEDRVYVDYIKTVKFTHRGLQTTLPIIDLNSSGSLELSFDDMDGGFTNFVYEIKYCDKDWNPSKLDEMEYVESFSSDEIEEYEYSAGTYEDYTHYKLRIPNDDVRWTKSGNYILVIYEDEGDRFPILTRRFLVVEPLVQPMSMVSQPTSVRILKTHQQVEFNINFKNFYLKSPLDEIEAVILQNGRWDNAITGVKPKFVNGDNLYFDKTSRLTFPALKEFRNVDLRSFRYTSEHVHSIDINDGEIDVLLEIDKKRTYRNFHTEEDLNGHFIIASEHRNEADSEAEYMNVIFTFKDNMVFDDSDVYIIGGLTDWQLKEEFRMNYNAQNGLYIAEVRLKQGFYDYQYALVNKATGSIDLEALEGNWYETENDYTILIYYSEFGARHDRLIAVANLNSNQ